MSCSGGPAFVAMVKATDLRNGDDATGVGCLDTTWFRAILLQCECEFGGNAQRISADDGEGCVR